MFWEEDNEEQQGPDLSVVDLVFTVSARTLPVDHAYSLSQAIMAALPWLEHEPDSGIHMIHIAESGNGWERPDGELLYLSRRTKFILRVPRQRIDDAAKLIGQSVYVDGHELQFTKYVVKEFSLLSTQHARYVLAEGDETENEFLQRCANELKALGIPVRKMMAGKTHQFQLPDGEYKAWAVMIADLSEEHAILLQQRGLGAGRLQGFGLFIPHKGITAVTSEDGKTQSID
ncbi:MAG: type I-MYXAN CRISPR-associated protein Cas6/Cmx6 [Gammaproteobacteria bacterium]|nr:type I-MYXAN CRISPR-associated protein Cas6/Cmx6 [Gammaproteobacteria bacterium]